MRLTIRSREQSASCAVRLPLTSVVSRHACMKKLLTITTIFLAAGSSQAFDPGALVGKSLPPDPPDLTAINGNNLGKSLEGRDLWVQSFRDTNGRMYLFLLKDIRESLEQVLFRIEAITDIPIILSNETLVDGGDVECQFDGKHDPSIYVVGQWVWKNSSYGYAKNIRFAWHVRKDGKLFESIPVSRVGCKVTSDRN